MLDRFTVHEHYSTVLMILDRHTVHKILRVLTELFHCLLAHFVRFINRVIFVYINIFLSLTVHLDQTDLFHHIVTVKVNSVKLLFSTVHLVLSDLFYHIVKVTVNSVLFVK